MRFRRRKPDYQRIAALEAEAETLDRIIDGADPLEVLSRELDRQAVEPHAFKPPILKKREPIPFAHYACSASSGPSYWDSGNPVKIGGVYNTSSTFAKPEIILP